MALSLKIAGVTFDNPIASITLPTLDGLVGEFILGTSQASSIINLANSATPATVTGSPAYASNFVTTASNSNFINLNVPVPVEDFTLLTINRGANSILGAPVSTRFSGFYTSGAGLGFWNSHGSDADDAEVAKPTPSSDFYFVAGKGPLGGFAKIMVGVADAFVSGTSTVAGANPRPDAGQMFGLSNSGFTVGGDTAYVAIYNRVLTDAQVAAAYASLKSFYAGRGLTVS